MRTRVLGICACSRASATAALPPDSSVAVAHGAPEERLGVLQGQGREVAQGLDGVRPCGPVGRVEGSAETVDTVGAD